jgi:biofilm PGA synthesis N-glycosyltransferase PgaC
MVGISAVKRQQGLFMGTLVAQGAFSVFRKQALFSVNGWQDRLGEDIVLTWALLKKGYKIGYEPTAFIFTNVPVNYSGFFLQRQRWARGMIEGFKAHISLIWKGKSYSSFFVSLNLFFPIIDSFFTFVFLPGLVLVFFGIYHIVGLATLFVLPITAFIIIVMLRMQKSFMDYAGLKMRYNPVGMVFYAMVYQLVMSPICVLGYFKELFNFKRQW